MDKNKLVKGYDKLIKDHGPERAQSVLDFAEFLFISDSPLWKPMVAEVFLQGWMEPFPELMGTKAAAEKLREMEKSASPGMMAPGMMGPGMGGPRTQPSRPARYETGPLSHVPVYAVLEDEDYLYPAMDLLGKWKEHRAGPRLVEIMQGRSREFPNLIVLDRCKAAQVIGEMRYVEGLDALLELVEDRTTPEDVRNTIFEVLRNWKDKRALPTLERISRWSKETHPELSDPRRTAAGADYIIKIIEKEK